MALKTFHELLKECDLLKVAKMAAHKHGLKGKKKKNQEAGYFFHCEKLLKMKPKKSPYIINVNEVEDPFGKEKYIDVYGTKRGSKQTWAIEFDSWREWLGMKVRSKYDVDKTVAECIWEMTFMGYEEKKIQKRNNDIMETVKRIKEGKEKLTKIKI